MSVINRKNMQACTIHPVLIPKNLIICSLYTGQYDATTKSKLQWSLGNLDLWEKPEQICSVRVVTWVKREDPASLLTPQK